MTDVQGRDVERLRWQSRRGLLELDIVLQRYWNAAGRDLDAAQAGQLARLLAMPDNDLLDLVMGRTRCADAAVEPVLQRLMAA
jgi:antitoxin CptB